MMKKIYLFLLFLCLSTSLFGQLIINEILYDPSNSGLNGDANGDGAYVHAEDEFLELYNTTGRNLDISGYTIYDAENLLIGTPNHTVPANTIIPPGGVFVVFGGGAPTGTFGGAVVQTSTFGDLNMNNAGDTVYIYDANGMGVDTFDIEPLSNNPNESYTRNPDITGAFEQHNDNTSVLFSPGTMIDGTPFNTDYLVDSLTIRGSGGATAITTMGGTLQMEALVFPSFAADTTVTWSVTNGTGAASIDALGLLTAISDGMVTVMATANDTSGVSASLDIDISGQNAALEELIAANNSIELFPNPAHTFIHIAAKEPVQEVQVYSLDGKLVQRGQLQNNQLDISNLQAGVYIMRVLSGESWKTVRWVKE